MYIYIYIYIYIHICIYIYREREIYIHRYTYRSNIILSYGKCRLHSESMKPKSIGLIDCVRNVCSRASN